MKSGLRSRDLARRADRKRHIPTYAAKDQIIIRKTNATCVDQNQHYYQQ